MFFSLRWARRKYFVPCAASFEDFDAFYREVLRQAAYFCEQSMRRIRAYEPYMALTGASPLLSGSMQCCMESGKDVYEGGAKYNDSSINLFGIATATDSLLAIKQLVFEEKRVTFEEMADILCQNWEGHEKLRLIAKTKVPKYGCGNAEVGYRHHSAALTAQQETNFVLAVGQLQPQHVAGLAKVGSAAAGIGGGVTCQKQKSGMSGTTHRTYGLFAHFQLARLFGKAQQVQNRIM